MKALLLILDPANTWDKIEKAQQGVARVFLLYLLPVMALSMLAEGWGLLRFGVQENTLLERRVSVPLDLVLRYEGIQFGLAVLIAFVGSWLFKRMGEGFHRRHSYAQAFATLAYSLGPFFLARMLDGVPAINTWICWAIGVTFALSTLYRGIPRLMKPDPSNALGLYLMCSLLLLATTGLAQFLGVWVLQEKLLAGGWGV